MSFVNKVVIVTGAASGIGAAAAVQFAEQGGSVVLVDRDAVKLAAVESTCAIRGAKPLVVAADVSNDQDAKRIIDDTIKHYNKLDILVNNAGIFIHYDDQLRHENFIRAFDIIMGTNLRGAVILTYFATPHLIKTKGNIVNISSVGGLRPWTIPSYCTSKAGLDHFSRCVALDLAPLGVRVNVVNAGPTKTDFMDHSGMDKKSSDTLWEQVGNCTALGCASQPDDVANVILFLASDQACSVTGSSYVIDNGAILK